jgi:hypothetical protein
MSNYIHDFFEAMGIIANNSISNSGYTKSE